MANKTKLKQNNKARTNIIRDAELRLLKRDQKLQRALFRAIMDSVSSLDIDNGFIINSTANIEKFNTSQIVANFFERVGNPELLKTFRFAFGRLNGQANNWFDSFGISNFDFEKGIVKDKMSQVQRTFLTELVGDTSVQRRINGQVLTAIVGNRPITEFRENIKDFVTGTDKKLGVIENHHFVQTGANEEFAVYDRGVNDAFAARLDLNYAVYQGGRINTTRDFCLQRNAKVFGRETILSWQGLDWEGKKENHNILLDAGGYNCRHYYDWISWELAKQLDPSIQRSQFDTI